MHKVWARHHTSVLSHTIPNGVLLEPNGTFHMWSQYESIRGKECPVDLYVCFMFYFYRLCNRVAIGNNKVPLTIVCR
jgi:hypothetical protein